MLRQFVRSTIRQVRVTGCRPDGDDALIVDRDLLAAVDLLPLERVEVHNLTSAARFPARCAAGPPGSRQVVCGGELARHAAAGDLLTITATTWLDREDVPDHSARVALVDDDNRLRAVLEGTPFDLAE
jgi:aspartate 1-decarboxylase